MDNKVVNFCFRTFLGGNFVVLSNSCTFALTESATLPDEQRTRAGLFFTCKCFYLYGIQQEIRKTSVEY